MNAGIADRGPTPPDGGHDLRHLFQPLTLRHVRLRNRIVFGAHTANMAEQGLPGARHLGYYRERAMGGAAMIVVEPVPVHASAVLTRGNMLHASDAIIEPLRRITDACHAEGAVLLQQLYHVGQHGDFDNSFSAHWSPSGLPSYHDADGSHAMQESEIEEVIAGFVSAAVRAQRAGFDGVELFGAYNGLIEQFWLPWSNRRDDRWGGSLDNRMRFTREIIERTRRQVGEDFIIGLNASVDSGVEVALKIEGLCEVAQWLDRRELIDYLSCGTGGYFNFAELMPTFQFADKLGAPLAEALKRDLRHARVIAESHIRTPENANTVVASGQADLVSIVRGQIADPQLANKARAGHADRVRGCISCNQMCWGRRSRDYWISCLVNPSAGREFEWGGDRFTPAPAPRHLLVVGAGPAGLEAARVAAERGHRVTLAEAGPRLGGAFRLAGQQPRRAQILELIDWYERELTRLGVDIRLHTPLDAGDIPAIGAQAIVVATGSLPAGSGFQRQWPQQAVLPGVELPNVWPVEDVMGRLARPGKRVVLMDDTGDWRGGGTAWQLAEQGHQVTIVSGWPMLGYWIQRTAGDGRLRARLAQLGARWMLESVVTAWHGDGASVRSLLDASVSRIDADALVLATTNQPNNELAQALRGTVPELHVVGDALAARLAVHAIYEARSLALTLDGATTMQHASKSTGGGERGFAIAADGPLLSVGGPLRSVDDSAGAMPIAFGWQPAGAVPVVFGWQPAGAVPIAFGHQPAGAVPRPWPARRASAPCSLQSRADDVVARHGAGATTLVWARDSVACANSSSCTAQPPATPGRLGGTRCEAVRAPPATMHAKRQRKNFDAAPAGCRATQTQRERKENGVRSRFRTVALPERGRLYEIGL